MKKLGFPNNWKEEFIWQKLNFKVVMNEAETRAELIDPKLKTCGWGVTEGSKILREYHITPIGLHSF